MSRIDERERAERAERQLGWWVARVLPVATVVIAVGVTLVVGIGPALLVLAGGVLVGCIALLWASVRTLSGDAPLSEHMEAIAAQRENVDPLAQQKREVLRAIKDLEHEHEIGKLDDADFQELVAQYRERAKEILRKQDADIEPLRARAEELARTYLEQRGLGAEPAPEPIADAGPIAEPEPARMACPKCATSNEPDAAFCKKCGAAMKGEPAAQEEDGAA